jgi:hypothetical protein
VLLHLLWVGIMIILALKFFFRNFPVVAVDSYFSHFCFHGSLAVLQVPHGNRRFKMNELIQNN